MCIRDRYRTNRDHTYLVEFRVGLGKVLATSFNILPRMQDHLEVHDFVKRLADYALGDQFHPTATVPAEEFLKLFSQKRD